ncbi:aromatic ring-hydroxylating oxygenase subunit alpha [Pseudogemmobacter humi]|uniref:Anthranilate 1,2-dioxygenase large subunit n=1 Tax=Pseudogemmobacter humi TaxID=2483812 RepID=A0A3P5WIK8_9RHOB|nr:aromatic ring-hydroxylating dioxygenase subunit alpha [Pseudogemmobacter humi]VDC21285.1 Anthranilate 1,2-dioxygenase large subunit [Pseudogemmobacter humi]
MYKGSPRLTHCPETLPREAYLSPDWFVREMQTVFARNWVMAGRLADLPPGTMRAIRIGEAPVLLAREAGGGMAAFHNTCRHRGSELCREGEDRKLGRLITCPYHAWAFAAADGRLVSTGHAHPTDDFRKENHGLQPVAHQVWNGFILVNLAAAPGPLTPDVPLASLDNWPAAGLLTGHRWQTEIACNWKVFWENYSECLHCPGIHPELCEMVPLYGQGIMGANEARDWAPDQPARPNLREGAESWTPSGALCGPAFPGLTAEERARGYTFVTFWPSGYVVAHADHIRAVRLEPLSPTHTRLLAEWYFPAETLAQPGFDPATVAAFAKLVMEQDGAASEMNQRGIASPAFRRGRLMPEEYEIHRFHQWLLTEMEGSP